MCKLHIKDGICSHLWPLDQTGLLLTPSPIIPGSGISDVIFVVNTRGTRVQIPLSF